MKRISTIILLLLVFLFGCKQQEGADKKEDKIPRNGYYKGLLNNIYSEGEFVRGEKNGYWVEYTYNEQVRRVMNYDHGKLDGLFVEVNRDGHLSTQKHYKDGKLDGLYQEFIMGVKVLHANYKDGILHGEKKTYYDDTGRIRDLFIYENGKKNGSAGYYYASGHKMARYKYKDDLLDGEQITYHENGKIMEKSNFVMGVRQGNYEEYNEDGKLTLKGQYINDQKDGVWEYYDEEGKVIKTEDFSTVKEK